MERLEARAAAYHGRLEAARAAARQSKVSRDRRTLNPRIVRSLLPSRLATMPARAASAGAQAADERLQALSPAYREAASGAAVEGGTLVQTSVDGLVWWVPINPRVTGAIRDRVLAKQRFPYRNITQTREFALGPVMLDIGANIGRMSIPRVVLGDVVRAYCAEPDPLNYAALVRNVADNGLRGLVLPDRVAIGAATSTARLRHAKHSGGHHLVSDGSAGDTIDVPCWRLDDWCERLSIEPDLVAYVKVDTQGRETDVLEGAPGLLTRRHIAWQLEVSPAMLAGAGSSASRLYELCATHFSHFVDLSKQAEGPRARPTGELRDALAYLDAGGDAQTDIVLFTAHGPLLQE